MVRFAVLLFVLGLSQVGHSQAWKGIDASFLPEMLYDGVVYRDQEGAEIESPRQWMAEQGMDLVRLRVAHPKYGPSKLMAGSP